MSYPDDYPVLPQAVSAGDPALSVLYAARALPSAPTHCTPAGSYRSPTIVLLLTALLSGCALVKVERIDSREYLTARRGDILSTGAISASTQNVLFENGIQSETCQRDFATCRQQLDGKRQPSDRFLAAMAELTLAEALATEKAPHDPQALIAKFLNVARHSYAYLFYGDDAVARALAEQPTQVRDYYNYATERVATLMFERGKDIPRRRIPLTGDAQTIADWSLRVGRMEAPVPAEAHAVKEVVSASTLGIEGLRSTYRRDGIGAELVIVWNMARPAADPVVQEIAYRATTILLRFAGTTREAVLASRQADMDILDPYQRRSVRLHGAETPLAGNFTGAYALWLARSGFHKQALRGLLGRNDALDHPEVLLMQPYDPKRLTIVLIHGLASSPEAWVNVANEILGDERLRDRFQIWQVYYPTNVPLAISQTDIRTALERAFDKFDPQRSSPASRNVVMIGHSMGGVISRLLVSTGGERIWEEHYQAPRGSERRARLASLEPYFDFEPLDGVDRVVFLAAPHTGTPAANRWLSRRVAGLIRLPQTLIKRLEAQADSIAMDLPEAAQILRQHPNAIDFLDSKNRYLQLSSRLTIAPAVTYHSIIAQRKSGIALAASDDGFVPYSSAYLPGAASTLIVSSGHSVQETPEAIREIRRILTLHAEETRAGSAARRRHPSSALNLSGGAPTRQ